MEMLMRLYPSLLADDDFFDRMFGGCDISKTKQVISVFAESYYCRGLPAFSRREERVRKTVDATHPWPVIPGRVALGTTAVFRIRAQEMPRSTCHWAGRPNS